MRAGLKAAVAASVGWLRQRRKGGASARKTAGGASTVFAARFEPLWAEAALCSNHGMAIVEPRSATLKAVNDAYAQLIGRTPAALEGQAANAAYPSTAHVALLVAEHSADLNGAATLETQLLHRDGNLIPVEVTVVAVREGNGPLRCRIQTVTDLRARLKSGRELRVGEAQHSGAARFRELADSAPVGMLLMDANGGLSYANPCWLGITGLDERRARGDGWWDAVHPDDRERLADAWEELSRGAPLDLEFRYRRAGGEVRCVESRATRLCGAGGAVLGFLCIDVDVTERRARRAAVDALHGRIRGLAQRLERQQEDERGALARRLHGTLRQDLTTLKGQIEALQAPALQELATRCLEQLRHITFELQPPGVEDLGLIDAMQRFAAECAAQSGLDIEVTAAAGLPDPGARGSLALYRTLQEALNNVVRHARAGQVEAHVWVQDGALHLRVSDDGVGIGDRDRGKSGCFGLLSASERLTQLGGALRVFGVPGRGTTLDASVPLDPEKGQRASAAR